MRVDEDIERIRGLRLINQGLVGEGPGWATPGDAARGMLALQAQDFSGAKRALSLRSGIPGARPTEDEVDAAIASCEVVRNRPSRGTLQFTAPEDLHWLTGLMSMRSRDAAAKRRGDLGVTDEMLAGTEAVLRESLAGGRILPRKALLEAFAAEGLPGSGQQASHILGHHTQMMNIVFATPEGKEETFALADEWISEPRELDRDIALAEVAERFFTARGPATVKDLAWWAHLKMEDVRRAIELLGDRLAHVELDGAEYLIGATATGAVGVEDESIAAALSTPLLLPPFDEYLIGYQDRSAVITKAGLDLVVPGRNGMFMPIIVLGGAVVGTWKRTLRTKSVKIELQPFGKLTKAALKSLAPVAAEYGDYLGLETELTVA